MSEEGKSRPYNDEGHNLCIIFLLAFYLPSRLMKETPRDRERVTITSSLNETSTQWGQCYLFSVVFNPSPPSYHDSDWVLHVISLLLTITLYRWCGLALS
jgi:hypothetical protein